MTKHPPARPPIQELRRRVHVGSGPKALKPDWWNVDVRDFPGVDEVRDITQPWDGFSDVTHVYGEHFLEHLDPGPAIDFLVNARRAMTDDGRLRLTTPSVEWVVRTHFDPGGENKRVFEQTFDLNRAFHGWGHRFLWSRPMLVEALIAVGYADVAFFSYGQSDDPRLCGVEQHGGYSVAQGFPSVWIVEARRGSERPDAIEAFRQAVHERFVRYVQAGH